MLATCRARRVGLTILVLYRGLFYRFLSVVIVNAYRALVANGCSATGLAIFLHGLVASARGEVLYVQRVARSSKGYYLRVVMVQLYVERSSFNLLRLK